MNIKKLFIITAITLQVSTLIHASQTAWNAAFLAFAGGSDPKIAAGLIKQTAANSTQAYNIANNLQTPEGWAVGAFVSKSNKSSMSGKTKLKDTDVSNAIKVALGLAPEQTTQLSDSTNWTAAFAAFTGGAQAVYNKTVAPTMPSSLTSSSAAYKDAQVIVQYLGKAGSGAGDFSGVLNATDKTNLQNAFTAAGVQVNRSPDSDLNSLSLKQTNGYALQQAIKSAQETFNLLVPGTYNTNYTVIPAANLPA